jgi:hypothetical protein
LYVKAILWYFCFMRYFYNYNESSWIQSYKYTDQTWLTDSLNWEKLTNVALSDYSLVSFLYNSSFVNQHFIVDHLSKISFVDILLLSTNIWSLNVSSLYMSFVNDIYLTFSIQYLSVLPIFTSSYQDAFNILLLFSPELVVALSDYFYIYYFNSTIFFNASSCFDSYTSNLNYNFSDTLTATFMFFFFAWFFIYFFYMSLIIKWSKFTWSQFARTYMYFFSMSKETRIQFETVIQAGIFFIFYWAMTIMAFDDDKEELIEYLDNMFFYFFTFTLLYFFYKHSVHYFSFLEASVTGSRSTMLIISQFKGDFLASFSMILRFYSLLLRLNVYDILDDCLDFYYIFIGDFDDDEYIQELFLSIHGTIFFTMDNQDDRSFLLEDENDFFNDLFYMYFVVWGKLFYFLFYTVELTARFGLAFYVIYLVLFEIYGVNCSFQEDGYFNSKKS